MGFTAAERPVRQDGGPTSKAVNEELYQALKEVGIENPAREPPPEEYLQLATLTNEEKWELKNSYWTTGIGLDDKLQKLRSLYFEIFGGPDDGKLCCSVMTKSRIGGPGHLMRFLAFTFAGPC
jgi:hypothetical protein